MRTLFIFGLVCTVVLALDTSISSESLLSTDSTTAARANLSNPSTEVESHADYTKEPGLLQTALASSTDRIAAVLSPPPPLVASPESPPLGTSPGSPPTQTPGTPVGVAQPPLSPSVLSPPMPPPSPPGNATHTSAMVTKSGMTTLIAVLSILGGLLVLVCITAAFWRWRVMRRTSLGPVPGEAEVDFGARRRGMQRMSLLNHPY